MALCDCGSALVYTTYIRVVRRNPRTHHNKQAYVPSGYLCLQCRTYTHTMDETTHRAIRQRRQGDTQALEEPAQGD